jgi:GT2 family glycosyltransferase
MASQPDLSIIILNYKMDGLVKNCLKSIFSHPSKASIEVVVVDNNSQDNCERMVQNHFPQARFIQTGDNFGYAKGNNIGLQQSTGRYALLVNPDVVFLHPTFDDIVALMDKHDTVGMATVQLRSPDGSIQPGVPFAGNAPLPAHTVAARDKVRSSRN